jgi:hypothetical protein
MCNLKLEVEFMEKKDLDEAGLNAEMEGLIFLANEFMTEKLNFFEEVVKFFVF